MPQGWKTTFRTLASLAIGAAAGVIEQVVINAHFNLSRVDWHDAGLTAAGTALVAVMAHWAKPPNTP